MHQVNLITRRNEKSTRRARILVIDDDESILQLIQDLLSFDYQVSTANDGLRGLELLRRENFDLLILDLGLPGLHGLDVIQHIRTQGPARGIPILVLSAFPDLRKQLEGAEVNSYLPKPFSLEQLERRVAQLLPAAPRPSILLHPMLSLQRS